jgi:peptidoglycan/xylan/chitin deacetylase (PgdA/CDA1 family)
MTRVRRPRHGVRSLVPSPVRQALYEWHPGRARRWRRFPALEHLPSGRAHAALTLDDGPDEDATPAVMDALESAGIRATFFFLAEQVERNPRLGRQVGERGHEVALHGHRHTRHDRADPKDSRADLVRGVRVFEEVLGIRPRWFRPPYGKMSEMALGTCRELGLQPVYWSAWGLDWEDITSERVAAVTCSKLEDGAIVLLHDSARYARRPSARPTADAIPSIARFARQRGLALVPLGEALSA